MAKKENRYEGYDITTQAVHTGSGYDGETGAVRRPLHMANSYKLPDDLSQVNYEKSLGPKHWLNLLAPLCGVALVFTSHRHLFQIDRDTT